VRREKGKTEEMKRTRKDLEVALAEISLNHAREVSSDSSGRAATSINRQRIDKLMQGFSVTTNNSVEDISDRAC
jgi:hypothetical protein